MSSQTKKQRNEQLAKDLLGQCEDVLEDFIRDNLDPLDMDDLVEQYDYICTYVKANLFRDRL